jgi:hypothetical protein
VPPLKALSVQQPWAWLLAHGHKDVENRSWRTKHRGEFLIHAGKGFDREGYAFVRRHFPHIELPALGAFERGGIVGKATLVDVVEPGSRATGVCTSPWYFDACGFLVADASPMAFVPCKGALNFFVPKLPDF